MFLENKYQTIYWKLIEKRKASPLSKKECYCESHHIIPKSLGGSNESDNLILLTAKEHFIAHLLLSKITDGESKIKMHWALHRMAFGSISRFSSKDYEWFRRRHSTFLKENHHSRRIENWSEIMSDAVHEQWKDNVARRKATSERMSLTWEQNRDKLIEHNRAIASIGGKASAKDIEYNGVFYKGWGSLKEATGISKHLYMKYYINGIDPTSRIGANGPTPN